jgi:hypothetical protein
MIINKNNASISNDTIRTNDTKTPNEIISSKLDGNKIK